MVTVYIRADKMYDSYERKVTDILSLMGDLGGLLEFFRIIGEICVGFIASKLFMSSIVRKIYHIRKYDNIEYEANKRLQVAGNQDENVGFHQADEEGESEMKKASMKQALNVVKNEEDLLSSDFKSKTKIEA